MHYFLTGHTGFKGAWLTLLLSELGHEVSGFALDPIQGSLFAEADIGQLVVRDIRGDIRDLDQLKAALHTCRPDVLVHLAAQPLVRDSYRHPRVTMETNVIGTMNVLDAAARCEELQAQIIVTTDKVYRNVHQRQGYRESDALGGHDPYSASKAMADILTQSWMTSFAGAPTAIARAGNVVGGGDNGAERLVPDVMRALAAKQAPELRNPDSIRPWQHVLDCLSGYLALVPLLLGKADAENRFAGAWNFGPDPQSMASVSDVTAQLIKAWGSTQQWKAAVGNEDDTFAESEILVLDSDLAHQELGWDNRLDLAETVDWTADWYKAVAEGASALEASQAQVREFVARQ